MQLWRNKEERLFVLARASAVHYGAVLLAFIMCGCCSISVSHKIDGGVSGGPIGGRYSLEGVDALLADALRRNAPRSIEFVDGNDSLSIPLTISYSQIGEEKDETSLLQVLPGCMTFTLFPCFFDRHKSYAVYVHSPYWNTHANFTLVRRDAFSSLPIGFLPYAFPIDGYEFGGAENDRLDDEASMNAVAEGQLTAIAKVVISTLAKERYDACIVKLAEGDRKRLLANEVSRKENILQMAESGWPQEALLRDFAIKETVGLWEIVIELRAEISERKKRLAKLEVSLMGFGRKPKEDGDYIKCQTAYDEARSALAEVFNCLEDACLSASKNAAIYESADARAKTRMKIDGCSRVALEARNRILVHK